MPAAREGGRPQGGGGRRRPGAQLHRLAAVLPRGARAGGRRRAGRDAARAPGLPRLAVARRAPPLADDAARREAPPPAEHVLRLRRVGGPRPRAHVGVRGRRRVALRRRRRARRLRHPARAGAGASQRLRVRRDGGAHPRRPPSQLRRLLHGGRPRQRGPLQGDVVAAVPPVGDLPRAVPPPRRRRRARAVHDDGDPLRAPRRRLPRLHGAQAPLQERRRRRRWRRRAPSRILHAPAPPRRRRRVQARRSLRYGRDHAGVHQEAHAGGGGSGEAAHGPQVQVLVQVRGEVRHAEAGRDPSFRRRRLLRHGDRRGRSLHRRSVSSGHHRGGRARHRGRRLHRRGYDATGELTAAGGLRRRPAVLVRRRRGAHRRRTVSWACGQSSC